MEDLCSLFAFLRTPLNARISRTVPRVFTRGTAQLWGGQAIFGFEYRSFILFCVELHKAHEDGRDLCAAGRGLRAELAVGTLNEAVDPRILKNGAQDFFVTASKLKKRSYFYNYVKTHSQENILTRAASLLAIKLFKYQTTPVYFDIRKQKTRLITDILLASSAIPLIFPDITIEGEVYIDGGIEDNVPIGPLYQNGIRKLIVVTMEERDKTCTQCFSDAQVVHINLAESALQNFTGTLDFNAENAKKRMEQGYLDGKAHIGSMEKLFRL